MKKYKLFMILLLVLIMAFPVSASASNSASAGKWIRSKVRYSFLTPGQESLFNKAAETDPKSKFTPVALLAERNIGGMEYAYLCKACDVAQPSIKYWFIMTAYKSINDRVTIRGTKRIRLRSIATNKEPRKNYAKDGFQIKHFKYEPNALSDSARKVFSKGTENYTEYNLRPIALLGTQEAEGKNYKFLCYGTWGRSAGSDTASKDIFVLDIHKDPGGVYSLKSCKPISLSTYVY